MIEKRWFQDRIRDAGLSQARLAQMLGIDRAAMSLTLSGKRKMQLEEAARIAEILAVDVDDVLGRAGIRLPKGPQTVLITGIVDVNGRVHDKSNPARTDPPTGAPSNTTAIRCEDRASVIYGWVFFFVPKPTVAGDALERVSIVRLIDSTQFLASVARGFEPGAYNLRFIDGRMIENARLISASPVLWIRAG